MKWTDLINADIASSYNATYGLIKLCEDSKLNWKPATGDNWMTTGQLLEHITIACGFCMRGFVTGKWCPDERSQEQMDAGEMLPPAEKLPTVKSVADALARLKEDEKLAYDMVKLAGESRLENEDVTAPWGTQGKLGKMLYDMVCHLNSHQSQLFYYLKLQGKPVHTGTLWGMPGA